MNKARAMPHKVPNRRLRAHETYAGGHRSSDAHDAFAARTLYGPGQCSVATQSWFARPHETSPAALEAPIPSRVVPLAIQPPRDLSPGDAHVAAVARGGNKRATNPEMIPQTGLSPEVIDGRGHCRYAAQWQAAATTNPECAGQPARAAHNQNARARNELVGHRIGDAQYTAAHRHEIGSGRAMR